MLQILKTILPLIGKGIHSVVFDPPYGRNSQGTIEHLQLVAKTLESLQKNATEDAQLIVFLPCEGAPVLIDREVTDEDDFTFIMLRMMKYIPCIGKIWMVCKS